MDQQAPMGRSSVRQALFFSFCLWALTLAFDVSAQERSFQMTLMESSDHSYVDLDWIAPPDEAPAAPRRMILQIGHFLDFEGEGAGTVDFYMSKLTQQSYNWQQVAAVMIDEPYWNATGRVITAVPCPASPGTQPDTRYADIVERMARMASLATAVKRISSNTRFWVNFSRPEMDWMDPMKSLACTHDLMKSYIDVISVDIYEADFNSMVKPYYDWILANRTRTQQQLALVPGVFTIATSPHWSATQVAGALAAYFSYANSTNAAAGKPVVWLIAGWPATNRVDPVGNISFRGMFDAANTVIRDRWRLESIKSPGVDSSGRVKSAVLSVILDSES